MIKEGDTVKIADWPSNGEHSLYSYNIKPNEIKLVKEVTYCQHKEGCSHHVQGTCQGNKILLDGTTGTGCWGFNHGYGISKLKDKYDKLVKRMINEV